MHVLSAVSVCPSALPVCCCAHADHSLPASNNIAAIEPGPGSRVLWRTAAALGPPCALPLADCDCFGTTHVRHDRLVLV
jgi:hypothetical protein